MSWREELNWGEREKDCPPQAAIVFLYSLILVLLWNCILSHLAIVELY